MILIGSAGGSRVEHFQFRLLENVVGFLWRVGLLQFRLLDVASGMVGLESALGLVNGV